MASKDEASVDVIGEGRAFTDLPRARRLQGGLTLLCLALVLGLVVGLGTVTVLRLADGLQGLVWDGLRQRLPEPLRAVFPIAACTLGGILVGAWTKHCGYTLDTLGTVVMSCRKRGGYQIRNWPQTLLLFLLPIAFGGAVGPEAGMSGFAAALATVALRTFRHAGRAIVDEEADPLRAAIRSLVAGAGGDKGLKARRRWARDLLWGVGGLGFVAGAMLFSLVFGRGEGMPRFEPVDYGTFDLGATLLALALALALLAVHVAAGRLLPRLVGGLGTGARAVVCGLALGAVACLLPDVLFSGQSATGELMAGWASRGPALLMATAACKLVLTNLCETCNWVGGEFFPLIFCGVSGGYAAAALLGADPLLPVAVCTGALVGAHTKKPLLAVGVLAICFPPVSLPAVAVAAFVGARVPQPGADGGRGE